jgi:hypothetical protein
MLRMRWVIPPLPMCLCCLTENRDNFNFVLIYFFKVTNFSSIYFSSSIYSLIFHYWIFGVLYIVTCYATEDAVRIGTSFITISTTRNYNHSQLFITLCHIYTAYNLTRQYSILFSHSLRNTLDIFTYSHFPCLSPIENSLFKLLKNWLRIADDLQDNSSARTSRKWSLYCWGVLAIS